ncbi:MAG: hypothetical protein L0Z50_02590, partial [Verrucomicrobiales bacterium]|nr:hypothetical protein [Verrucomicrobiales bacterium]
MKNSARYRNFHRGLLQASEYRVGEDYEINDGDRRRRTSPRFHGLVCFALAAAFLTGLCCSSKAQGIQPFLLISELDNGQFELLWPATATDFALESSTDLNNPQQWQRSAELPQLTVNGFSIVVRASEAARFFRLRHAPPPLPLDPASVAPPLPQGSAIDVGSATAFLYAGANPIQTDVANGTIQPLRAAVLRGRARQRDGSPLSGVRITVLNHPEFGQTLTRADGWFDVAINGGATLTVEYDKSGFCPVQRQIRVAQQDYTTLPEVVIVPRDPVATPVTLGTNAPMQLVRGTAQSDADGPRQAMVIVPPSTSARLLMPNGQRVDAGVLTLRLTELTVGANGLAAMPAPLPPTSAYTYCIELSSDEAMALGAKVQFTQPLCFYLENFLNFPVGTPVPVGRYDRERAAWVVSSNGIVIKILAINSGKVDLDTNGDGSADDAAVLARLNITDQERAQLATLYKTGQSLWRSCIGGTRPSSLAQAFDSRSLQSVVPVQTSRLAPANENNDPRTSNDDSADELGSWDFNWAAISAGVNYLASSLNPNKPCPTCPPEVPAAKVPGGSVIDPRNQILGEDIPLVGVPFDLHYRSDRMVGRTAESQLVIPITGTNPPVTAKRIDLQIDIAGRQFLQTFPPATPDQSYTFAWDALDAYGRRVEGSAQARATLSYVYEARYAQPAETAFSFALAGGAILTEAHSRDFTEQAAIQQFATTVSAYDARNWGMGGWTLSAHHTYDPIGKVLFYGFGGRRAADGGATRTTAIFAGNGLRCQGNNDFVCNEGRPAIQVPMTPTDLAFGPDGSLYFVDSL